LVRYFRFKASTLIYDTLGMDTVGGWELCGVCVFILFGLLSEVFSRLRGCLYALRTCKVDREGQLCSNIAKKIF
jgi:hypothetical protein